MSNKSIGLGLGAILVIVAATVVFSQIFIPVATNSYQETATFQETNLGEFSNVFIVCDCENKSNADFDNSTYLSVQLISSSEIGGSLSDGVNNVQKSPIYIGEGETKTFDMPNGEISITVNDINNGQADITITYPTQYYFNNNSKNILFIFGILMLIGVLLATIPVIGDFT